MTADFEFDFNMEDFSDVEFDLDTAFETRYIKPPRQKNRNEESLKYANAQKLANDLCLKKGDRYFVFLDGSFIFGDFIEAFIVEKNLHVKKMTISTLSLGENNVDSLANLLKGGYVDELNLIVSVYFFSHERHNLIPYIYQELDKDNKFQLAVAATHCKICQFETHNNGYIFIHGSANLRSSDNIEQIEIEENEVLYKESEKLHDDIIEKYKTIDKAVRNKALREVVKFK